MSGRESDTVGRRRRIDSLLDVRIWWPYPAPLGRWIGRWRARVRGRRFLEGLDDRALRDIGLDRADVETESTLSFWRQR
jgi:uncharacterized protein YjiS (DUF1127 family)